MESNLLSSNSNKSRQAKCSECRKEHRPATTLKLPGGFNVATDQCIHNLRLLGRSSGRGTTHPLILVGEEKLEYFTIGNNWVPAHSSHPALQPLHAHLNKFFLKTPWNRGEDTKKIFHLKPCLSSFFNKISLTVAIHRFSHLPVTCLSGKEGIGIADPNLSRSRSYSQSKCLYL